MKRAATRTTTRQSKPLMTWFSERYCTGAVSRQLPQRGLQTRLLHRLSWLGAAQMGSFEAILLIASSSTALFWLAVRMA